MLAELRADIVALQEVDRRFGARASSLSVEALAEKTQYRPIRFGVRPASLGWHGNVILVREGVEVLDSRTITLPALEPRGAVMADVRVRGQVVRVVGMHSDLSGLWRRRQAHAIIAHLQASTHARPTVLMGDLNEWSADRGCLHDFAQHFDFAPTRKSFHARRPMARLDRIMVSRDLRIEDAGVHESLNARTASDHLPIWAKVRGA